MSNDTHIHIDDDNEVTSSKPSVFVRVAVIVGMLIILFLIAIAIVRFVPKFISSFGQANVSLTSLFSGNNATTTPDGANNNTNNQNNNQNSQYPASNDGSSNNNNQNQNQNSNNYPNNNTNSSTDGNQNAGRPTQTYPSTTYYPATPADLSISLVKVGRILSDGSFQQTTNFNAGDRVTVQFTVANVGGSRSGSWMLTAKLPTSISYEQNYTSVTQPTIAGGSSYLMTLAFDSFSANMGSIQIVINSVDANVANNTLTIPVTGTTYNNNNNNNNCYWSNNQYYCNNNNNNYGCYWQNGQYYCNNGNNYNNSNNCYWSNGQYYCNNNNNNCYWSNNQYYCNNNNNNYGCYWQNGYQVCSGQQSGYADLDVRIISTGVINRSTGQYTSTGTITRNDRAGVQVEVRNTGSVASTQWSLTASLTGGGSNSNFSSGTQSVIQPGQSQIVLVSFENPTAGYQTVSVNAFQQNNAYEQNTGNNYVNQGVNISN